jgi:hypothetical protein
LGGGGGGLTNMYGTNLWLYIAGVQSNSIGLFLMNTEPDIEYEIQSRTDLLQTNWFSEGFVAGSELTNFTEMDLTQADRTNNLFMRIRSWQSSDGSGIPDWWWLTYFGQTTNVDASAADPAGDGYSNWQKFQMGLNPTNYYNPNAPGGFFGSLDSTGTNVVIDWSPAAGPVLNYVIQRGIQDTNGNYVYSQIGLLSSNAIYFVDVGAITNDNSWNNVYNLWAVYPGGSLSAVDTWYASDVEDVWFGPPFDAPPYAAPMPENVYAYAQSTGTNVLISWTPPTQGSPTNYIVERGVYDSTNDDYDYTQIAALNTNTTYFQDVGALSNTNVWNDIYGVVAVYPGGGLSQPATASINTNLPSPTGVSAVVDSTGTNVLISWTPPQGVTATNYVIERGILNTNTSTYSWSQIGSVSAGTTSFEDVGAITSSNSYNNAYEVKAVYPGGAASQFELSYLPALQTSVAPTYNFYLTAQLVRNQTGHWQLMFSSIPTNVQSIALYWYSYDYFYDFGSYPDPSLGYPFSTETDIAVSSLTNGIYVIPDAMTTNGIPDNAFGKVAMVQPIGTNGEYGNLSQAGFLPYDAPCFVDGRQHLKQNLLFELREATISQRNTSLVENGVWTDPAFLSVGIPADTNYVESSFFHWAVQCNGFGATDEGLYFFGSAANEYVEMDDLWPFTANYELHQSLYDPSNTVPSSFVWQTNLVTVPASAVLGKSDPYWISQNLTGTYGIDPVTGLPTLFTWNLSILPDLAAYTNSGNLYLQSGSHNLFGLAFATALVNQNPLTTVALGSSTALTNVNCFFSQTADPGLQLVNYYFAPVTTPGTALSQASTPNQLYPLPVNPGFAVTNQTGLMIGSIGNPMVIGGWAKYSITNGSSSKYAYLGQYFVTNAYLIGASGTLTTNTTGIVSPYGDFFPTEPGAVAMITMPDIDTGQQGTNVVDIISLNVDANHDGTMDLSYQGPDFVSPSKPFRFWANDNQDAGDDGGNYGIPGFLPGYLSDGFASAGLYYVADPASGFPWQPFYRVHGRRDLVDYFPVYLNIGSLFQSNALSAGISVTDTNYQFVLSQEDGVLRFVYTDLTPTNYMNYLLDTNESRVLSGAVAMPVNKINFNPVALNQSFLAGIATNNQGIILVEAATNTTQPLVLTIYHGTNLIAQTSLPLSISGVEQMFRHKNLMLNTNLIVKADRLTDASVPNEPDTIDKNFVFLHGYNVLPNEARGVAADMFKRMYWSGSHAKFWAVTWEGADTKGTPPFYDTLTPNYHTNVFNAFQTAPSLANFIATLTNSGPVVVSAHSLGNIVTLSAISDWNAPISQFFMLDSAAPIEAVDPTAITNMMIYSTWVGYSNRLFASDWYQLFPTNDNRSTLFWNNRLGNLHNVDVYNFYSSGEEVLRTTTNDPPPSLAGMVMTQISNNLWDGIPFGTYTWYWQEKGKGTCSQDWFLGSSSGGWGFNKQYGTNFVDFFTGLPDYIPMAPSNTVTLTTTQLQTNAFFGLYNADVALQGSSGSTYAQANRNRILSDAIPAMSMGMGANPVSSFDDSHNLNMNTPQFQNGWSQGRTGSEVNMWHHSDFVQMAYTFTYKLFNQFVTTGNLK